LLIPLLLDDIKQLFPALEMVDMQNAVKVLYFVLDGLSQRPFCF
jgi:hypothetical protein